MEKGNIKKENPRTLREEYNALSDSWLLLCAEGDAYIVTRTRRREGDAFYVQGAASLEDAERSFSRRREDERNRTAADIAVREKYPRLYPYVSAGRGMDIAFSLPGLFLPAAAALSDSSEQRALLTTLDRRLYALAQEKNPALCALYTREDARKLIHEIFRGRFMETPDILIRQRHGDSAIAEARLGIPGRTRDKLIFNRGVPDLWLVFHECAHILTDRDPQRSGIPMAGHSPAFVKTLIGLYRDYAGLDERKMTQEAREYGLLGPA